MDRAICAFVYILAIQWMTKNVTGQRAIAQGACRTYRYRGYRQAQCSVPGTAADMTLRVSVVRDLGPGACLLDSNYRLSADNTYITVDYPCSAVFLVEVLDNASNVSTTATTTKTTTTTTTTTSPAAAWGEWGAWGGCTASCGGGLMTRTRRCSTGDDTDCATLFSYAVDTRTCNTGDCAVATAPPTPASPLSCGVRGNFRVIGGAAAGGCEFPWMVLVYDTRAGTVCGGSILDETTILTAAHCLYTEDRRGRAVAASPRDVQILSGSSMMPFNGVEAPTLVYRGARRLTPHPQYDPDTLANDIALIKLSTAISYDACHAPVCLTDGSAAPQQQQACLTMGWGVDSNRASASVKEDLYYADVPVADDLTCRAVYGRSSNNGTFCAGGEGSDACSGDSGGPLVCAAGGRYLQEGVVSAGIEGRCGGLPGLYTRVAAYLSWIAQNR